MSSSQPSLLKGRKEAANTTELILTDDEQRAIVRSWVTDHDAGFDLALNIYEELFKADPEIAKLFPTLGDVNNIDLRRNTKFQKMAIRLVQTLSAAVSHLRNFAVMNEQLDKLGQMHAKFIERGFKDSYWISMEKALNAAIGKQISNVPESKLNEQEKLCAAVAWSTLISHLLTIMQQGMSKASNSTKQHSSFYTKLTDMFRKD